MSRPFYSESNASMPVGGRSSLIFGGSMLAFVAVFVVAWITLIYFDVRYTELSDVRKVLASREIHAALWLTLWTSMLTVLIGMVFAIPMGYALSRYRFPGHALVDSIVDLPILMPPLIVGLSLLVFFRSDLGQWIQEAGLKFVFQRKGIVLCQLLVSASFGIRAMKLTFDGIDPRIEHVAMTLGCSRWQAFFRVALPMARRGIVIGAILIWTRAFGIFGPLKIFVGTFRMRTEVLPTTIDLEASVGQIGVAMAIALLMLALATVALVMIRTVGLRQR